MKVKLIKRLPIFILVLFFTTGAGSAFAQVGSLNTGLHPSKDRAISAAEQVIDNIRQGRKHDLYARIFDRCQNRETEITTEGEYKIISLWVPDENHGYEKMYYGRIDVDIHCSD